MKINLKFKFIKSEDKKTVSKVKVKIYYCRELMEDIGEDSDAEFTIDLLDGKYPDWKQVFPDLKEKFTKDNLRIESGLTTSSFNVNYLMDIKKVFKRGTASTAYGITLMQQGSEKPTLVKVAGVKEFVGLIMPMRTEEKLDNWVKEISYTGHKEKKEKKAS